MPRPLLAFRLTCFFIVTVVATAFASSSALGESTPGFWRADGRWYKGNLHTHTTESDGAKSPEEMIEAYRARGYDFLAITDHNRLTRVESPDTGRPPLLIPGEEITAGLVENGAEFHFVAVNLSGRVDPKRFDGPQEILDAVRAQGGEVIIAHPRWSGLTVNDLLPLKGYLGIEVYNASCEFSIDKGRSLVHWDDLLARGRRVWGLAHDDSHAHGNDHRPLDVAVAYTLVKARELTVFEILRALRAGEFYACSGPGDGPRIEEFRVEGGCAYVRTSEAKVITIATDAARGRGERFAAAADAALTEARYKLRGKEKYLRVEVTDRNGQMAWSNPIFLVP